MKFPLNGRKSVANSSKIVQSLSIKTHQEKPRRGVWPQSNCCCCCRWWCCCCSCCCYCCCWVCAFGKRDLAIVIDTDAHYAGSGCVSFTATSTLYRALPRSACPFCRCSQSAAGSDNCQLGAILQCDSGSRDNNNTGNGQKKPHHLFPFVCPQGGHQQGGRPNNVYALVCAHFQCNFAAPRTPLLPRTKVCNSHWQTAPLCYLVTVHLTNTNTLAPAPGTAAPSPCSAAADCGYAGDAHLKTTIINCLYLPGYWTTTWPPSHSATN